jgi:4-amino-4-deoxy-L-arabinose transferase-like glycosyltransferase
MSSDKNYSKKVIFVSILGLAVFVRLLGIGWGLPYTYHVDENWFAQKAIHFFSGDLNPHFFGVPTLFMYMLAGIWKGYYVVGHISGQFRSTPEFMEAFVQDSTVFYLLGRILTALLGIGTILMLYLIGKKMYGLRVGAAAALFLIFSPEHNKNSHEMTVDVPMIFFLVLAFYFIWLIYKKGETKYYLLAGLFAGLGTAVKFGGQILFLPLFLAHLFHVLENNRPKREILFSLKLVSSGIVFLAAFLLGCPYSILDFKKFWKDFKLQSEHLYSVGHFGDATAQPAWLFYLIYGFKENIGLFSRFLVLGGLVYGFIRRRRREMILLAYPLLLFFIIGSWKTRASRYFLPLAPFFILAAAMFLDLVAAKISSRLTKLSRNRAPFPWAAKIVLPVLCLLFVLPSAARVLRFDYLMTQPDTRTIAKDWIHHNIPRGTKIAMEINGPPISRDFYTVYIKRTLSQVDMEWLARKKAQYIVIDDIMYARFTRFPDEFPREAEFYNTLDREAVLIKTITPKYDEELLDLHNPTIKIYKLSSAPYYGFPGNFSHYSQNLSLAKTLEGDWTLKSSISAGGWVEAGERIKNPYVRITNAEGRDILRLVLREGEIPSPDNFSCSSQARFRDLPEGARIYLGYEFFLWPNPLPEEPEGSLRKEFLFPEKIDKASLRSGKFRGHFWHTAFPNSRGDDYFQSATLTQSSATATLRSQIFGGGLRYGACYVLNPFVLIRDGEGKDIQRLTLFQGKVGSYDAERQGPVEIRALLHALPDQIRVFAGYEIFFDKAQPDKAGGPQLIELTPFLQKK